MISDLCWTNSRIFNPLCSSPLSPLLPLSRGYCFAPLFGWNKLLPPSSLYFPPFTSPLLCVPCFSFFFCLFSFSLPSCFSLPLSSCSLLLSSSLIYPLLYPPSLSFLSSPLFSSLIFSFHFLFLPFHVFLFSSLSIFFFVLL